MLKVKHSFGSNDLFPGYLEVSSGEGGTIGMGQLLSLIYYSEENENQPNLYILLDFLHCYIFESIPIEVFT